MANPIWKSRNAGIAAVAAALALWGAWAVFTSSGSVSGGVDFEPRESASLPVSQGQSLGVLKPDASGWAVVEETERYVLKLQEATGNVAVVNRSTGFEWTAFPGEAQLAKETVSGTLRANLESPFIMEYFEASDIQRKIKNAKDPAFKVAYSRIDGGFAADYSFEDIRIGFRMTFELTDDGLRTSIPVQSVKEDGAFKLVAIDSLPFFGAAGQGAEAGYMFIPDGPGGLIRFPDERETVGQGYEQPVYGTEYTSRRFPDTNMSPVAMPVFGMKQGDDAFVAIIEKGEYTAAIKADPPGIVSGLNAVNAKFVYREEYDRRLSLAGKSVRAFQDKMAAQDRVVEYRFLSGDEADYVGMAHAYRRYLEDAKTLAGKLKPVDHVPLDLTLIGGDTDWNGHTAYEPATTFPQAQWISEDLKKSGVEAMTIIFENWQKRGSLSPSKNFSLESRLGGADALRAFVRSAHDDGYKVMFKADVTEADSDFVSHSPKSYGIRSIEGDVLMDDSWFWFNPNASYRFAKNIGGALKTFGVDGIQFSDIGSTVFRDYNPKYDYQREDTAYVYQRMLEMTKRELGSAGVGYGNAYSLKGADHIQYLPDDLNHFYDVDEIVPFSPIVLHGSVSYSMSAGNIRNDAKTEFLRAIEYGAVPAYELTYSSTLALQETYSWGVYSSRYSTWKDRLLREYRDFDRLAAVYDQPIADHRKLEEGVFETTYGNGVRVVVDYNGGTFRVEGGDRR